jgi:hypothetical protein
LVVFTYDPARIYQVLEQNRHRFGKRFVVNLDVESVEVEDDSGELRRYTVERPDESDPSVKHIIAVSVRNFLERMLPQLENALIVMYAPGGRSWGPPPRLRRSSAIVLMAPSLDEMPEGWEVAATDMFEAHFADGEEVVQVLGRPMPELRGVMYGELLRLRDYPPEKWLQEADRMRNIRILSTGLERMGGGVPFAELPLDGYFKRHLSKYLGRPANLVFTGSPGCGKTTIAKSMAREFRNCYLLDAGKVLERERRAVFTLALRTLRYISNVSLVINEMDHLVLAGRQYFSKFLSFLEENHSIWLAGTMIDIRPMLREEGGAYSSELLRPGRIDEVIPVPPPLERPTREAIVRMEAEGMGISLSPDDVRRIASAAPLLYPSDYLSLIQRYASEGKKALYAFSETYDEEARRQSILETLEKCRLLGNTTTTLLDTMQDLVENA